MINGISKIVVPVDDQLRAKDFWTTRLGFEVVTDESYGDERWIEVIPPTGSPVIVLSPRTDADPKALQIRHEATQRPVPRFCGCSQGREDKRPSPPTEWASCRAGVGRGACGSPAGALDPAPGCPAEPSG